MRRNTVNTAANTLILWLASDMVRRVGGSRTAWGCRGAAGGRSSIGSTACLRVYQAPDISCWTWCVLCCVLRHLHRPLTLFAVCVWHARTQGGSGGTLVNFLHAVFGAGSLCAPLLANQSLRFFGSSVASYYMASAITAVSAASFLLLPSPRRPNRNGIGGGEGGGVGGEGGMPGDPEEQQQPGTSKATAGQLAWGQGRMWAILLPLVCLVFCAVGSEVAFGGWIATYSEKWAGASLQDAQLLNAGCVGGEGRGVLL